jgi:hypothetical protein
MVNRIIRVLVVLAVTAAAVAVPAAAHAAPSAHHCVQPTLATGFGPLELCMEAVDGRARTEFWSPITLQFTPTGDFFPVARSEIWINQVNSTDGVVAVALGWGVLSTAFGATVYAVQRQGNQGRWGNVNLHTNLFYPSTGWLAVVPTP